MEIMCHTKKHITIIRQLYGARQNKNNYRWLYNHMIALGIEYTARYGKTHLTITKCEKPLGCYPPGIPNG